MPSRPARHAAPSLPPVLEFLRTLWSLNHELEVTSSNMLRRTGVTAQQRMVLRIVGHMGSVSAGHLSEVLHVHPGTLSATLGRLERRGLLRRRRAGEDGRRVIVTLTPGGEALLSSSEGRVERATAAALAGSEAGTIAATLQLMTRIREELEGDAEPGESAVLSPGS